MRFILAVLLLASTAHADCIAFVTRDKGCYPCELMKPKVEHLRQIGVDIRTVDYKDNKEWCRRNGVTATPTFLYLQETPAGVIVRGRIVGLCSEDQILRLCYAPEVVTVGAATRSMLRGILGTPLWEW